MRKTRNPQRPPEPATAEDVLALPGFGHLTHAEAEEIARSLWALAVLAFEHCGRGCGAPADQYPDNEKHRKNHRGHKPV